MTGLFTHQTRSHRGPSREYIAKRRQYQRRDLTAFAEALAEGATIAEAGRAIGVSRQVASKHFRYICTELGPQAC